MKGAGDSVNDRTTTMNRGDTISANSLIIDNDNINNNQIPADQPTLSGAFGLTRDTTTEQVIKLYGICGAGSLVIVTIVIVSLDCCNDSNRKEYEELAKYRMLQENQARQRALARRRPQQIPKDKEEKPKSSVTQIQGSQVANNESNPLSYGPHHYHPHYFHHVHQHSLGYPIPDRSNLVDMGVNTSDKFVPPSYHRNNENTTQTDRTEGTQTSAMELNGIPSNVTEIIHERTIVKGPRELLGTIKESMAQQDRLSTIGLNKIDVNTLIAFV
ncbi:unnamed protein product [Adineta steineri]|uniref:Uncharacterized protein n=1 Tax=Adineta steineri TaxID=433720 RepID=A0A815NBC0_9BILA|nr:unnamed protein product [Adineta steineri]CAF1624841.1 unnamed protein product [Adineta steineri]